MERINWSDPSLSGGLFEKIVGCLLGLEHPRSVRVRPAQGDGGVDIFDPVDVGMVEVHQAKHYPNRLHWTKIEKSLGRLSSGEWLGRRVRDWYLTVPKQPTPNDLAKLDELAQTVPFDLHWFGEDRLAALVAAHPEVGDYYLGDGRAQLERHIEDWEVCLERVRLGNSPRIEDVQDRLVEIAAALGRQDPHLEYGVEVHPVSHDAGLLARPHAIALSSCVVGGAVVTCHVYPRYRGADEDAADRLQFRLDLTPEAAAKIAEVIAVGGSPVALAPSDISRYELPTVGHQAPAASEFHARLTPEVDTTPAHLRLVITRANGDRTVARLTRSSISRGNEGATSVWTSPHRCIEVTLVFNKLRQRLRLSIRRSTDFDGPIADVAGDIDLMRAMQPGAEVALALDRGPIESAEVTVVLEDALVDLRVVAMLDALRVIQDHTRTLITVPDEITGNEFVDLVETAALLDGLPITGDMRRETTAVTLEKSALGPGEAQDVFADDFTLGVLCSAGSELHLPHQIVDLADELLFIRVFRTARAAAIDDSDAEHATITLEPGAIPIWIDQRIKVEDDFTDALHHELCKHNAPVSVDDLADQLSRRGSSGWAS